MDIRKVPIEQIKFAPYNPRVMDDAEFEKLKHSITVFGYVDLLVWNQKTGNVVGGNQRLKAALALGFKEIEVVVVDLPIAKEKALNIALNKISGKFDLEKLAPILTELQELPDFDVGLTGFDLPEIRNILDSVEDAKEDDFDLEKDLANKGEAITQKGDLIKLGCHCLYCGDSSDSEDVKRLIGDAKVNLIFSDPPYNVNYYGGNRPINNVRPKKSRDWARIYNDNLSQEEYEVWLQTILKNVSGYLAPGAPCYLWNGHAQFGPMHSMLTELGFHVSSVITWAKESFAIGYGDYNNQTEFCLYSWKEDNGAHNWYGPTNESTLWQIKRDPTKSYNHPTTKPLALAHRAIKNSSKRGDIVLDMFLGSGTTLIAAEGLERTCIGLEIDPYYCDAIVKRYIAYVGRENVSEELVNKYLKEDVNAE